MKTLSLAGGWCWYPFSTVPRISHTYTVFALFSLRFLLWLWRKTTSNDAVYTSYPAWQIPPLLRTHSHSHMPAYMHTLHLFLFFNLPCSLSSLCINIKRLIWYKHSKTLTVCFQLPCHHLILLFSVYSGIYVRKYILGWLIPPRLISAAGWWLPAALCGIFVWRAIFENKFCRWYKSDH